MGSSLLIDTLDLLQVWQLPLAAETSALAGLGNTLWVAFQVAAGLGFVIFVHELGHFLAAKTFGVRCDKFYVGFDVPLSIGPIKLPSTLGKFQWGETEYGIGIIPLGGYVKMLGQDDDPRNQETENSKIRAGEGEDAPLDPRSYPAKPVWQRMIIISAGVVMNLIFAVILAGIAYRFGVPYTPTVAGGNYAGGPTWVAGLETGDQVMQLGSMNQDFDQLRFDDFRMQVIMSGFARKDEAIPFGIRRGDERFDTQVIPTTDYTTEGTIYLVGMRPQLAPKIGGEFSKTSFLRDKNIDLQAGDVVTAVNGDILPKDPHLDTVLGSELTARLQEHWRETVTLTVERESENESETSSPKTLEVEVPAVPVQSLGLGFAVAPVTQVLPGSLAEDAGFRKGDIIESVNGEKVVDALTLPATVAKLAGQEVTIGVLRASESNPTQSESLDIVMQNAEVALFDPIAPRAGQLSFGGVGLSFGVSPIITSIDKTITGEDCPLQVGDELAQVHWQTDAAEKKEMKELFNDSMFEPLVIGDSINVASLHDLMQGMPVGTELTCRVRRDGKVIEAVQLPTAYAKDWYWHVRSIRLSSLMQIHKTDDVVSAAKLGLWETSRRFSEVLNFLKLLVTGRIGFKGLGGPGTIAYAAASEANLGVSRLLLFLTLLSANLAILNFLPIPALDGGHMVFLTAEAIMGRPVNEALQIRLTMLGVLGLLSLMAIVIVKEILWFAS